MKEKNNFATSQLRGTSAGFLCQIPHRATQAHHSTNYKTPGGSFAASLAIIKAPVVPQLLTLWKRALEGFQVNSYAWQ